MRSRALVISVLLLLCLPIALAHEADFPHEEYDDSDAGGEMLDRAAMVMLIAGIIIGLATFLAMIFHERLDPSIKWLLFLGISIPVVIATVYSATTTISLNLQSETKGPVHWHADFEIWVCGKQLELQEPTGLSNRLGTELLHEHGDLRIHAEGVLMRRENAALGRFFHVIGGLLSKNTLGVPTKEGLVVVNDRQQCPDGIPGTVQVFRWQPRNGGIVQQKLVDFSQYLMSPESNVPPGDCIIIEFGPEKKFTDRLCASYRAAIARGELHGG